MSGYHKGQKASRRTAAAKRAAQAAPEPSDEPTSQEGATTGLPESTAGVRLSANTWWCPNCGAGNRIGAEPEPACGSCGTPIGGKEE